MAFRLNDKNTRFSLPIIHPISKEVVSAEQLYNSCCDATGRVVTDHIGDLVFDNLAYDSDPEICATDESNEMLHDEIYKWADDVHAQLRAAGETIESPFSTWAFLSDRETVYENDQNFCIVVYDNLMNDYSFSQELLIPINLADYR